MHYIIYDCTRAVSCVVTVTAIIQAQNEGLTRARWIIQAQNEGLTRARRIIQAQNEGLTRARPKSFRPNL